MDLGIRGKRALVCGASKGMGQAVAQALADEGAELFLCSRDKASLSQAAAEIEEKIARQVFYEPCDLTDPISREGLITSVKHVFPAIDILIHNVGGPRTATVLETRLPDWEKGFNQLFQSVAHLNEAFIPSMMEQRWGRVVTITSLSVMEPIPGLAVSNAMRAAVTGMLKTLSDELAEYGICINCVAPGIIQTDRTEERIEAQVKSRGITRQEALADYVKSIPARRLGTADEFAAVVVFLCSQQASYVTGSTICVDGGKRRSAH
jgi:3-oxoacyl-[acyl-carrier protein] reductase